MAGRARTTGFFDPAGPHESANKSLVAKLVIRHTLLLCSKGQKIRSSKMLYSRPIFLHGVFPPFFYVPDPSGAMASSRQIFREHSAENHRVESSCKRPFTAIEYFGQRLRCEDLRRII